MNRQHFLTRYNITFNENGFELNLKPTSKKEIIFDMLFVAFWGVVFIPFSILGFVKANYFYAIAFLFAFLLFAIGIGVKDIINSKKEKSFVVSVNNNGIKHIDINATYHINWCDVAAFGFVDDNVIAGIRRYPSSPRQICLYFSRSIYDESYLRRKFDRMYERSYLHCSTEQIIVLGLLQPDLDEQVYNEIKSYIHLYCDKSKERSFFRE